MIEIDELIVKSLKRLPGEVQVFKHRAVTEESTYVVFYVWNERDFLYAGNEPIGAVAKATVNVYSDDEEKKLVKSIRGKLRKAGFSIDGKQEFYNEETERIQIIIEISYEDLYG
jgi:hypothetical protein